MFNSSWQRTMSGARKNQKRTYLQRLRDRQKAAIEGGEDERSREFEQRGFDRAEGFDPNEAIGRYTEGVLSKSRASLSDALEDLKFDSAAGGRINTGLFDIDRGDVARRVFEDANANLQQAALEGSRMEQDQGQFLTGAGMERRNRYFDLLHGGLDREEAKRSRKKGGGLLGSVLGTVAGSIAGPIGGAIGGKIAKRIFS